MTQIEQSFRTSSVERPVDNAWAARLLGVPWKKKGRGRKVEVKEAWVEAPLGAWVVAYRLVDQSGVPVVAELRIFPCESGKGRPPGRWSADFRGAEASAPPGGIPADLLRQVRVTTVRSAAADFLRWLTRQSDRPAARTGEKEEAKSPAPTSSKRRGKPDEFYADLAKEYVGLLNAGSSRPVAEISEQRSIPKSKVRDMVRQARWRDLLTETMRGKTLGQLTPLAKFLLQQHPPEPPSGQGGRKKREQ